MNIVISIDPGISKCGLTVADIKENKVYEAIVVKSSLLLEYVKKICKEEYDTKILIGNGTSSKNFIKSLNQFYPNVIVVFPQYNFGKK